MGPVCEKSLKHLKKIKLSLKHLIQPPVLHLYQEHFNGWMAVPISIIWNRCERPTMLKSRKVYGVNRWSIKETQILFWIHWSRFKLLMKAWGIDFEAEVNALLARDLDAEKILRLDKQIKKARLGEAEALAQLKDMEGELEEERLKVRKALAEAQAEGENCTLSARYADTRQLTI